MNRKERDARKLAQRLARTERRLSAALRARQIAFSDVPVTVGGVTVDVAVPALLQEAVTAGEVAAGAAQAIPFIHRVIADVQATTAEAEAAALEAFGLAGGSIVYQATAPVGSATLLWLDTSVFPGSTTHRDAPMLWDGAAWVAVTDPALVLAARQALTAWRALQAHQAAASASEAAAQAAALQATTELRDLELTPLRTAWDAFYGTGGSDLQTLESLIGQAQASADGAIRTFYQDEPPWPNGSTQPASAVGDLWLETDTAVAYRWTTNSQWEVVTDSGLAQALAEARQAKTAADAAAADAANAQTVASAAQTHANALDADLVALSGRTGRLIRSATAPTGADANANNLWLNTSTGQLHEYGTAWTLITDQRLTAVVARADQAWNLADDAKASATTATSLANAAQTAANDANTAAGEANTAALAAQGSAAAAQSTADSAQSAASVAQGDADAAASAALVAAGLAASKGRVWTDAVEPPTGKVYSWAGAVNNSQSIETTNGVETRRNLLGDPLLTLGAEGAAVTGWVGVVRTGGIPTKNTTGSAYSPNITAATGATIGQRARVKATVAGTWTFTARETLGGSYGSQPTAATQAVTLAVGEEIEVVMGGQITGASSNGWRLNIAGPAGLQVLAVQMEVGTAAPSSIFSGATPDDREYDLWINTAGGLNRPHRWDGTTPWAPVTDKAATDAAAAAATAQSKADSAFTNAGLAQTRADQAVADALAAQNTADTANSTATTATGKYTVAAANPTTGDAAGKVVNSVWEVRSGGITLRRYVLTTAGASPVWTQVKIGQDFIGTDAIGNAQIGNLAVGTAEIADGAVTNLKVGDLDAGKLWTRSLTADKAIFEPANLFPDPLIADANGWPAAGNAKRVTDATFTGGFALEITQPDTTTQVGSYYRGGALMVLLEPGERYRVRARVQSGATVGSNFSLVIRMLNSAGASVYTVARLLPATGAEAANTRKVYETTFTAPATGLGLAAVGFFTYDPKIAGAVYRIADVVVVPLIGGTQITPEGVDTPHLRAQSVQLEKLAADVGKRLDISSNQQVSIIVGSTSALATRADTLESDLGETNTTVTELSGTVSSVSASAQTASTAAGAAQSAADAAAATAAAQRTVYDFTTTGAVIYRPGSDKKDSLTLAPDGITMAIDGAAVTWWRQQVMHVNTFEGDVVNLGKHEFKKDETGTGTIVRAL